VTRTVLMNAGPWLPVPPDGYGGIENVVAALVPELRMRGIRVLLATVARSTLPADERLTSFRGGQFEVLQRPYNQVSGVAHAHRAGIDVRGGNEHAPDRTAWGRCVARTTGGVRSPPRQMSWP